MRRQSWIMSSVVGLLLVMWVALFGCGRDSGEVVSDTRPGVAQSSRGTGVVRSGNDCVEYFEFASPGWEPRGVGSEGRHFMTFNVESGVTITSVGGTGVSALNVSGVKPVAAFGVSSWNYFGGTLEVEFDNLRVADWQSVSHGYGTANYTVAVTCTCAEGGGAGLVGGYEFGY